MSSNLHTTIGSELRIGAQVEGNNVQSNGGSLYPKLVVPLVLDVKGMRAGECRSIQLGIVQAELIIAGQRVADSIPYQLNRLIFYFDQDEHVYLEFPLDAHRLEWIEQQRSGSMEGSVRLKISCLTLGSERGNQTDVDQLAFRDASTIHGDIPFTVADTQWREKVLPGLGHGKVIAIELPAIPTESFQALEHSYKALEQAQKQFLLGHYDDAVGKCRVALDQFFESVDKGDGSGKKIPKLKKSWETKLGESTYRWLNESFSAIKDAANKPHHSPNSHFDRLGAQMLLMVTTALLSCVARQDGK
ncbi:MAG TPA: hypothetical protein VJ987_01715 [Anaerolineales bacterium]|nr:hypothetical protein [Anaerolineales bacterium]